MFRILQLFFLLLAGLVGFIYLVVVQIPLTIIACIILIIYIVSKEIRGRGIQKNH